MLEASEWEDLSSVEPSDAEQQQQYRGPGLWLPALEVSAQPVDISLITTGLMKGESIRADGLGDHAVFYVGGNTCAVDATSGYMDTDTDVDGTIIEVVDVQGNRALVLSDTGIQEVTLGGDGLAMGGQSRLHRSGSFGWARYLDDQVIGLTPQCVAQWDDGRSVSLPEHACVWETEIASTGTGLLLAGPFGLLSVEPEGPIVLQDDPVEHLALDRSTGMVLTSVDSTMTARGGADWSMDLGPSVQIQALASVGDLGLFLVDLLRDGDRRVEVFDSATGERMGALEVRESTEAISVSPQGGLLLQVRRNDVVSWRITR